MKLVAAMGIAGVVVALDCAAGTLLVPTGVTTNINVAADTTLTDAVTVSDRSAIEKTGAGTLTLPGGQFTQNKTVQINVREGAVAFTPSPQALAAYPQPTETMNKAAFWLESRTNLVKEGDDIVAWRDVRDVDPAATNHYYAVVEHSWSPLCPQETNYMGKAAVYFRGYHLLPRLPIRLLDELADARRRTGDRGQPLQRVPRAWRGQLLGLRAGAEKRAVAVFPAEWSGRDG